MNKEEILPIGSVVLLKNQVKRVMITGFLGKIEQGKVYDYMGCLFPEGVLSNDKSILFDKNDIDKIYYIGYVDNGFKELSNEIKKYSIYRTY